MNLSRLLSALALVASALAAPTDRDPATTEPCGIEGDDNTYGLGIRLGVYLQWITTSLANNFVPEEAMTIRGVNHCFQLANFAGLVYITSTRDSARNGGQLYAVEAFVVLLFCTGSVCSGRGYGNAYDALSGSRRGPNVLWGAARFAKYKASTIGGMVQLGLVAAILCYAVWFVYIGMDGMAHPACSRSAFFFAKVDLYDWFRTLLKVVFTLGAIVTGLAVSLALVGLASTLVKLGFTSTLALVFAFAEETPAAENGNRNIAVTTINDISFSLELPFFILSTEFIILWNQIHGVNQLGSTGQLLPLIVSSSSLVRVLYKFVVKFLRGDYSKLSADIYRETYGI